MECYQTCKLQLKKVQVYPKINDDVAPKCEVG
jgi:hypothetical protein